MFNLTISEYSKPKEMTWNSWVEKGNQWELSERLKFGSADNLNIDNQENVLENEMYKIFSHFEILTNHQIPVRGSSPESINKKNSIGPQSENKSKWKYKQIPGSCQTTEKAVEL